MTTLDASAIDTFYRCREEFRNRYIDLQDTRKPNVHLEFGSAIHAGCAAFWNSADYDTAFVAANKRALDVDQSAMNPKEVESWNRMCDYLPDLLAEYFRFWGEPERWPILEIASKRAVEYTWSYSFNGVLLCGRLDHVFEKPARTLSEIKTATEIGQNWRSEYQMTMTRNTGLALYDWFLRQLGIVVDKIQVEVLLKPNKSKSCRMEIIDLPEIMASRKRFDQQIAWKVAEIGHYIKSYSAVKPWPMADGDACKGRYNSPCPWLPKCVYGETPRVMKLYGPKKPHVIEEVSGV